MKKKPVLLKRILGEREEGGRTTIGLMGTHSGVGVTHTGILIGNSLRILDKNNIAYIEMSGKNQIKYLQDERLEEDEMQNSCKSFQKKKVTYFSIVKQKDFIPILNEPFRYFILDFGSDFKNNSDEFLRCDKKLVICSFTKWKRDDLESFIEKSKDVIGSKEWEYLSIFSNWEEIKIKRKQYHIHFNKVGFEPNLFTPDKEFVTLCERIIC